MNQFSDQDFHQELERLELQTLQGFWRVERLLEDIYRDQQSIIEQIEKIKLASTADNS